MANQDPEGAGDRPTVDKDGASSGRPWFTGLRFRIAVMLSIAILPIGAVGIWQAERLLEKEERKREEELLAVAMDQASDVEAAIETAFSAIDVLIASETIPGPRCAEIASRVVQARPGIIFAGFTDLDGMVRCRSDRGDPVDVSGQPTFQAVLESPRPSVTLLPRGAATGRSVVVVSKPLERDGALQGFLSVSIPRELVQAGFRARDAEDERRAALLGPGGRRILGGEALEWVPVDLSSRIRAADGTAITFRTEDYTGKERLYVLTTILPGDLFELTSWPGGEDDEEGLALLGAAGFPILMWLVAMLVSYIALEHLVVGPILALRSEMRAFGSPLRRLPDRRTEGGAAEIVEVRRTFASMARRIVAEEARMADLLQTQRTLLHEVYHRVQNNLQIITSIIRMQFRELDDPASQRAVMQMEDRAMTIATVHALIYESEDVRSVDAAALIGRLLDGLIEREWRGRIGLDVDQTTLSSDQALCVAMIVTETMIAAEMLGEEERNGSISLSRGEDREVCLRVRLSGSDGPVVASCFGRKLIEAFALQMGGRLEIGTAGEGWQVTVRFELDKADIRPGSHSAGNADTQLSSGRPREGVSVRT